MVFRKIDNVFSKISKGLAWVSAALIFCMSAIIFVAVIARYFFNSPITGVEELIQIGLCMYVYTALGYAIRHEKMVSVPVITEKLNHKAEYIIRGIGNILCAVIGVLVMYELTIPMFKKLGNTARHATSLLHFPEGIIYLVVTVCYILIALEFILKGINQFIISADPNAGKKQEEPKSAESEVN